MALAGRVAAAKIDARDTETAARREMMFASQSFAMKRPYDARTG
jgi:hypothetical protein